MLKEELDIEASPMTVRRAFKEAGLGSIEKKPKPMLSAKNIKARLEFANLHKDWTVDDWKRVIWSDETKINRFCSDGRAWAWIFDGQKLQPHHVKQTVKHGGGSLMVWGCMTAKGPGFMCRIDGTMTKDVYLEILQDELQQTIEYYGLNSDRVIFQHDNDPKHTALLVRGWIEHQPFQTLKWPAQSPDLNPIETLWAVLKGRLNGYERAPKGMIELWERIEEVWNEIKPETCMKLIESIPKRIQDVLDANGRWTEN
jgi:DDE superfamily endonuclease/Transposase